jgi:N-methylhydantoinase B
MSEATPKNGAPAGRRIDPVTASVIHGALEHIAVEMGYKLMRMSYSSIIRESEDFGAALVDTQCRQLCETRQSTPLQSGPIPGYVRGVLRQLEARGEAIEPGDVIMHNDALRRRLPRPRRGVLRAGVSRGAAGRLLGDHRAPSGHRRADAGELRHRRRHRRVRRGAPVQGDQGVRGGRKNTAVWHMLRDNIRASDLVVGDMEAQIAAARIGAERYVELIRRYGLDTVNAAYEELLDYSERMMRAAIERLPDGVYRATTSYRRATSTTASRLERTCRCAWRSPCAGASSWWTSRGRRRRCPTGRSTCRSRAPSTSPSGSPSGRSSSTAPSAATSRRTAGSPGPSPSWRPKGTLANPIFPAPTIARFCPGNQLADTVMKALAPVVPTQVSAGIGNLRVVAFSGLRGEQHWVHMEIFEGSYGGRHGADGMDAVDTLYANTRNNPIEDIESHLPLRVERYELREDACAAGQWRGGLGAGPRVHVSRGRRRLRGGRGPQVRAVGIRRRPGRLPRRAGRAPGGRQRRELAVQGARTRRARAATASSWSARAAAATEIPAARARARAPGRVRRLHLGRGRRPGTTAW